MVDGCTLPEEPPPSPSPSGVLPAAVCAGKASRPLCDEDQGPLCPVGAEPACWTGSASRAHSSAFSLTEGAWPLALLGLLLPLRVSAWSSAFQAAPEVELKDLGLSFLIGLSFLSRQGESMKRSKPVSASWSFPASLPLLFSSLLCL